MNSYLFTTVIEILILKFPRQYPKHLNLQIYMVGKLILMQE